MVTKIKINAVGTAIIAISVAKSKVLSQGPRSIFVSENDKLEGVYLLIFNAI
jgi:hypothetical protein